MSVTHERPATTRCFQWVPTDESQLAVAERLILSGLSYVSRRIEGINTISSLGSFLNPTSSSPQTDSTLAKKDHTVVLLHGFAGGVGIWAQNWKALADRYNVHAIDLPGFAASDRTPAPKFKVTEDAMRWYEERLEAWFSASGIPDGQRVTLVGHSFGGYIAAQFVTRRMQRVLVDRRQSGGGGSGPKEGAPRIPIHHVVLADPWGVPVFTDADAQRLKQAPLRIRLALKLFYRFSPLAVVRAAGPFGPNLLPKVRPDFASRWDSVLSDPLIFYDYTYHCNAAVPATGELAFQACCHQTAFAKEPLATVVPQRMEAIVNAVSQLKKNGGGDIDTIPETWRFVPNVTVMYGRDTWMTISAGFDMASAIRAAAAAPRHEPDAVHDGSDAAEGSQHHVFRFGRVTCTLIDNAGHQLNTDNAPMFNERLVAAIEDRLPNTLESPVS